MIDRKWHNAFATLVLAVGVCSASTVFMGCGDLRALGESCASASDCPAPWVCCSETRLPTLDTLPICEERNACTTWMPLLVEGNPCNRTRSGSVDDQCSDGLECCMSDLTCAQPGQCPQPPIAPPEGGSGLACGSDLDCSDGEICCNINYSFREGACSSVAQCISGDVPSPPVMCDADGGQVCNDACTDVMSDDNNCGDCDVKCGANGVCVEGQCMSKQQTCAAPFMDCNNDPVDTCETNTDRTSVHCGGCNMPCPTFYPGGSDLGCQQGMCVFLCNGGFHDCNDDPADGCESTTRCR